jgi:hypothetical protein
MNYPFSTPSPYIHAAMSQAIQAMVFGCPLSSNCVLMAMPFQQAQQILPQLMMNAARGGDPIIYPQQTPYYGPSPYANNFSSPYTNNLPPNALAPQQNYNYPIVPYKESKKKSSYPQQPHSNFYNSSSFDSYMENLSWSRLFDRPSRKNSQPKNQEQTSIKTSKKSRSDSSTSSSSTTSDETIRLVNVTNKPSSNIDFKQQTKGSLPFKYSSEFVPGIGKQQQQHQSQKIKSNDVFIIKKP